MDVFLVITAYQGQVVAQQVVQAVCLLMIAQRVVALPAVQLAQLQAAQPAVRLAQPQAALQVTVVRHAINPLSLQAN